MTFKNIAVTGGSGRLGRYVVAALRPHYNVTVLDLAPPEGGVPYTHVDVLDAAAVKPALEGQDAVVHLAGLDLDQRVSADAFIHVNTVGTWNVMEAAHEAGIRRVVQCSSVAATGLNEARTDFRPQYLPVDEDHPARPRHPYGVSKLLQEQIGRSFNRRGQMDVISLRVMMVLFPSAFPVIDDRLSDPDGGWLSYFISPGDAARAFLCALQTEPAPDDTYFITAADTCRDAETLSWLRDELGNLPKLRKPELYAHAPRAGVFDGSRARDDLGFTPQDDWPTAKAGASVDPVEFRTG